MKSKKDHNLMNFSFSISKLKISEVEITGTLLY